MSETNDYFKEYLGLLGEDESIQHYGAPRRSGRYPWGSGKKGLQRNIRFIARKVPLPEPYF